MKTQNLSAILKENATVESVSVLQVTKEHIVESSFRKP